MEDQGAGSSQPPYLFKPIPDLDEAKPSFVGHERIRMRISSGGASPSYRPTPKLYSCYRTASQDVWSSAGSRHSSRPGSSASSRPSSRSGTCTLYNRSNNNSLTDVTVTKNFQQLSVSTRRAAFKSQKWSHSFDQGCIATPSSAQTSPGGRRSRQASLQQKSLDLDSGYHGSSTSDLLKSSTCSWNSNQYSVSSPLSDARQELKELQDTTGVDVKPQPRLHQVSEDLSRSASLPSFNTLQSGSGLVRVQQHPLPTLESTQDLSENVNEDQLDEEIKMIVALGETTNASEAAVDIIDDDVLTYLSKHCSWTTEEEAEVKPEVDDDLKPSTADIKTELLDDQTDSSSSNTYHTVDSLIVPPSTSFASSKLGQSVDPVLASTSFANNSNLVTMTDFTKPTEPAGPACGPSSSPHVTPSRTASQQPRGRLVRSKTMPEARDLLDKIKAEANLEPQIQGSEQQQQQQQSHRQQSKCQDCKIMMHLDSLPNFTDLSTCCCTPLSPTLPSLHSFSSATATDSTNTIFQFPTPQHNPILTQTPAGPACVITAPINDNDHNNPNTNLAIKEEYQAQLSPMAISPSMSTLNTPRGSITSMRSQRHSPMNTDITFRAASNSPTSAFLDANLMSYTENNIYEEYPQYPSPPRSGYASPIQSNMQPNPPSYEEHMNLNYGTNTFDMNQGFNMQQANPSQPPMLTKTEPEFNNSLQLQAGGSVSYAHHCNSSISIPEEIKSDSPSDTCPETPDSSVKDDFGSYICLWAECNVEFDSQRSLVDHVNEAHVESSKKGCEDRPCFWKDCPRKLRPFNAKYKLSTHMRVHTKEKPYKCEFEGCTRAFARLENRKIHQRSHTGHKPFPCKYAQEFNCSKRFSNSSDRAKHEQTHKDPKPYRCEVVGCTKRYTDPSSLRKHVKSHSQEEQEQYRLFKDHANQAKRSFSPATSTTSTASQAPWSSPEGASNTTTTNSNSNMGPGSTLGAATTLLAVGLQSGGTIMTVDQDHGPGQSQLTSLPHQPSSLDDLEGESIPFDDVPLRLDQGGAAVNGNPDWHCPPATDFDIPSLESAAHNLTNL